MAEINCRERYLAVMRGEPGARTLLWGFGYWVETVERWYGEGLQRTPLSLPPGLELRGGVSSELRSEPATGEAPHVFYVILDAYARHDVLAEHYGFDNTPFLEALRERGFYVAAGSESNYTMTSYSLTSSLNMSYIEDLREAARREGKRWSTRRLRLPPSSSIRSAGMETRRSSSSPADLTG
jgi:hypothetical protein